MKFLLDQNISPRLIERLADMYPDSSHVSTVGLDQATDIAVWEYARDHGFIIVTKDSDFNDLSLVRGLPPKVIWMRLGNCTTSVVEQVLRHGYAQITAFAQEENTSVLELI